MASLAEAELWEASEEIDPGTFSVIMGLYENIGREMMITLERSAWAPTPSIPGSTESACRLGRTRRRR